MARTKAGRRPFIRALLLLLVLLAGAARVAALPLVAAILSSSGDREVRGDSARDFFL